MRKIQQTGQTCGRSGAGRWSYPVYGGSRTGGGRRRGADPCSQTQQQETDTEADEADVDTEADEAAALPELSEDREVAEEDEAVALPELSEDREVAEEDEAAALPELDEDWAVDEAALLKEHKHKWKKEKTVAPTCTEQGYTVYKCEYNIFGYGCTATKKR